MSPERFERMTSEGAGQPRVVSLLGAATEVIYALGLQYLLVGRSHECKRPPSVLNVPCLSSPALAQDPEELSSGQIDTQVRYLVEHGLARYHVDVELLRKLKPDIIITQDQCGVCAVTVDDLEKACGLFLREGKGFCKLVSLKPLTIADVFENIQTIANACSVQTRGEVYIQQLKARWESVRTRTPQCAEGVPPVTVACLQWLNPVMGAGYWVPEIVECAGGVNLFGDAGGPTPAISWHDLLQSDPDVVVVMCCGIGIEKAGREMGELESHIEWRHLRAVKAERVFLADGDRYFNNSGASVVDSAELMAEILHGSGKDHGAFRYEGKGYVRWDTFVSLTFLGQRDRHLYNGQNYRDKDAYITYHGPHRSIDSIDTSEGREDVIPSPVGSVRLDDDKNREETPVDLDTYKLPTTTDEVTPQASPAGRKLEGESRLTVQSEDGKHVNGREPGRKAETLGRSNSSDLSNHLEKRKGVSSVSHRPVSFTGTVQAEPEYVVATPGSASQKTPTRILAADEGDILSTLWASTEKAAAKARGRDPDYDEEQVSESPYSRRKIWLGSPKSAGRLTNGTSPGVESPSHQDALASRTALPSRNASLPALSKKANQVREIVLEALGEMVPADCILLSGGLDTSILAEGAALIRSGGFKVGITVCAGKFATDGPYAAGVAKRCGMEQIVIGGGDQGDAVALLEQELDFVVETLKTFDPMEIRNSVAVAAALREADRRGFTSAVTGDGADELFAGYNYMHSMPEKNFNSYRQHLATVMRFSAVPLGEALGIEVRQPYLHPKVVQCASKLSRSDLIGVEGKESEIHGKLILRRAFPGVFSAWRRKDPIEVGSGTTVLPQYFTRQIASDSLQAAVSQIQKLDKVQIRDAEHLCYYLTFKRVFNNKVPPGMTRWGSDPCFACGYQLSTPDQTFCITCGQYPARNLREDATKAGQAASAYSESGHTDGWDFGSVWWGLASSAALVLLVRLLSRR